MGGSTTLNIYKMKEPFPVFNKKYIKEYIL